MSSKPKKVNLISFSSPILIWLIFMVFQSPTLLQYHSSVDEWTLLKPPPQLSYALSVTIKNTIYLVGSRQTQR